MLSIPTKAIRCYEELTNTTVVVYIYDETFSFAIRNRDLHRYVHCEKLKSRSEVRCAIFDSTHFRWYGNAYQDGCLKICHAQLLEWVVPVIHQNRQLCTLIAGIRRAPVTIPATLRVHRSEPPDDPEVPAEVPYPGPGELERNHEALRQLAARLKEWYLEMQQADFAQQNLSQTDMLRCIIHRECMKEFSLDKLAAILHLSASRTAHLVKEQTGESFRDLVKFYRLERAAGLLRSTGMPINKISEESGFTSLPNFHRSFQKRYKISPRRFRNQRLE